MVAGTLGLPSAMHVFHPKGAYLLGLILMKELTHIARPQWCLQIRYYSMIYVSSHDLELNLASVKLKYRPS